MDDRPSLSPGVAAILAAARERGISVRQLSDDLFQFEHGGRQRRLRGAESDDTAAIAKTIAHDKELARSLMTSVGVPVPYGRPVNDAEDAWAAAQEMGLPGIVKPQYTGYGWTSTANINTREEALAAYELLRRETGYVLVEHCAPGDKFRLLVVGTTPVMACRCDAPSINDEPTMTDVTAAVHPTILEHAINVVRVVGLDVGAVGVIAKDIAEPLEVQEGIVFGVQPAPDLTPYVRASSDEGCTIGRAIIAAQFPDEPRESKA